jgi:hypothetical protein
MAHATMIVRLRRLDTAAIIDRGSRGEVTAP